MKLFTIKDNIAGIFSPPFGQINEAMAYRTCHSMVNSSNPNELNTHTEDKSIWYIGEYDETTGILQSCEPTIKWNASDMQESK